MNQNAAESLLRETNDFQGARPVVDVTGMSSPRVCTLLNRLVASLPVGEHYLEVGTWRGLTLLSAASGNTGKVCIACDKFRFWGRFTGFGWRVRRAFEENLRRFRSRSAYIDFHHMTCERLFAEDRVQGPIGVYFFDGDHSYRGTRFGIAAAAPVLATRAIVLVDDWRHNEVRQGTRDGFSEAGLRVLWERELIDGRNNQDGWWNGLGIFFVEKPARADVIGGVLPREGDARAELGEQRQARLA